MMKSRNLLQAGDIEVAPLVTTTKRPMEEPPVIDGLCVRLPIREGFEIICYDMTPEDAVTSEWSTGPGLSLMLLVQASGTTSVKADGETQFPLSFAGGTAYVMLGQTDISGRNAIDAASRFQGADLRVSHSFLQQIGLSEAFAALDGHSPGCKHTGPNLWLGTLPLVDELRRVVDCLLRSCQKPVGKDDLIIEAHALQLLHGMTDALSHDAPQTSAGTRLNAVLMARTAMCEEPGRDWTITTLARHCGLNSKSFKQAFRDAFGCTTRQFLQRARVEEGRRLLDLGQSVTDASLAVGYANPSHFAKLYKRYYGVSPSKRA